MNMESITFSNTVSENSLDILVDTEPQEYADGYSDQTPVLHAPEHFCEPKGGASIVELARLRNDSAYQMVTSASGHSMAVWRESDGMCYHIWANRYVPGTGWGTALQIDGNTAEEVFAPRIAMNNRGEAVVVWQQSGSTGNKVWANRYESSSGWSAASLVTMHNVSDACAVQIAIDDTGNAMALWRQFNGDTTSIWSGRYELYGGWGVAAPLNASNRENAFDPQINMAANGHAMAVWTQSDGRFSHIWAKRYIAYEGWGRAMQIDTASIGKAFFPQVAMNHNGDTIAAWHVFDGIQKSIWANDYSLDLGWRGAKLMRTMYASLAFDPQASLDLSTGVVAILRK
jgi:hypothetical protein